jgi:nitrile hydratase subunit beta
MSYRPGLKVRVAARKMSGHHRTPGYLKGKTGRIERVHASFRNPESRAYGGDGLPEQTLYLVRFEPRELWPGYRGGEGDRLYADIFEHWLEADE